MSTLSASEYCRTACTIPISIPTTKITTSEIRVSCTVFQSVSGRISLIGRICPNE